LVLWGALVFLAVYLLALYPIGVIVEKHWLLVPLFVVTVVQVFLIALMATCRMQ
jgi:hypothetical protein